ncbi:hypothetical protein [Neptunomonas antarctica]|uniref:hypothetical protein n=1 Tax=Neptunomonas antarctica TaxID=619304 RepID=UPI0012E32229|nr:hypothetical protein [Neptunomonas antarctica]
MSAIGTSCGAVYFATSYVTAGDSAEIGELGCDPTVTVSEPYSLLIGNAAIVTGW